MPQPMSTRDSIINKLREAFAPESLDVSDESHLHEGHAGHRPGGETHFRVYIVSPAFEGKSRIERHRMINATLSAELAGSVHALAELYCGLERREALRKVLDLHAQIRASLAPGMDHSVAHQRLDWWQHEALRLQRGEPAHPLTRWLATRQHARGSPLPALLPLVQATALALAVAPLGGRDERQAYYEADTGTLFVLIGAVLSDGPQPSVLTLRALGGCAQQLLAGGEEAPEAASVRHLLVELGVDAQPALVPLLVWLALAHWRGSRGETAPPERAPGGRYALWSQNFVAWRAARAALRGQFGWPPGRRLT